MKIVIIATIGASLLISCALIKFMNVNEMIILILFICALFAYACGSLIRATKQHDVRKNCKHDKFIGDVCACCGYCFNQDKKI